MNTPETMDDMDKIIEQWVDDVDGYESMDRSEMLAYSGQLLSIIHFIEEKIK